MSDLLFKDLTYKIIGAAQEVHRELGKGYLESVYEDALCYELNDKGISFNKQDEAQLINYLKTTGIKVGLLFNFGSNEFEFIRRIF